METLKGQSGIHFEVNDERLVDVIKQAKDWALTHGLIVSIDKHFDNTQRITFHSFNLLPVPVPAHLFNQAKQSQLDFNLLLYRVSRDYDFLRNALRSTLGVDDFTSKLFKIYQQVYDEGNNDSGTLVVMRSDFMLDTRDGKVKLKQVELNTIAVGLGSVATIIPSLHRYTLALLGEHMQANQILDTAPSKGNAAALIRAWELYEQPSASIMLVSEHNDQTLFRHRLMEFTINGLNPTIPFIRRSLFDIGSRAELTEDKKLRIDGYEVAVVYYRSGYTPESFKTQTEWNGKLLAERSCAIKCPSISYHLAGTKKVQQVLSEPGVIERFIKDPESVNRIRETFCNQYSLDQGTIGDHIVAVATETPDKFVMKPNREGGGTNLFGDDIRTKLTELKNSPERAAYILMDKMEPLRIKSYQVSPFQPVTLKELTYEIGIYGALLSDRDGIVLNEETGHMLRTKRADESCFTVGHNVIGSPLLFD